MESAEAPKRTYVTLTLVVSTTSTGDARDRIQIKDLKVQRKQSKRMAKGVDSLSQHSQEMSLEIKRQRDKRLSLWAKKYHWTLHTPPPEASDRPEILAWWTEWRDSRLESLR